MRGEPTQAGRRPARAVARRPYRVAVVSAPAPRGPRLRDLGLRIGGYDAGPADAITDVDGVRVGHVTVWRDEPGGRGIARTGVTAILPGPPGGLFARPVPAGAAVLNGAGEMTGFLAASEWGAGGDAAVPDLDDGRRADLRRGDHRGGRRGPGRRRDDVVIPLVAECDDSWLSDSAIVQVAAEDAGRAVAAAAGGAVAEGAVGAGTGMVCFDWKGGIGTASRLVPEAGAVVGVLVLANFGSAPDLRVDGVPVGRLLPGPDAARSREAGSCIAVVATDAALNAHQLTRLARRAGLGLARTGSVAHHGSGEIFAAFATTGRRPRAEAGRRAEDASVADSGLNGLFAAVVDAAEEAVLNALWAAPDVTGRAGPARLRAAARARARAAARPGPPGLTALRPRAARRPRGRAA